MALPHEVAHAGGAGPPTFAPIGTNSANASGLVGGGHAGYNWQQGAAVFGFETDLQATQLHSLMNGNLVSNPPGLPLFPGSSAQTSAAIDWYGTFRGRLGVASGPLQFYGTGGLAYGKVGLNSHFTTLAFSTDLMTSEVKTGWVAGAGLEYLWRPDLSFSLLYQYVDLGRLSGATSGGNPGFALNQTATTHAQFQTVMAGLSWHFAPVPSSGPWAGGYAGGHLGGAWGNNASANYNSSVIVVSDVRLKRDVALVGRTNDGLGIYSYKYLWSDAVYVGVMAQEVALIHPEAIVHDALTGYLAVDYGRLGLPMP